LYVRGDNRTFQIYPQAVPNASLPKFPGSDPYRVSHSITLAPDVGSPQGWKATPGGNQGTSREYDANSLILDLPSSPLDPAGTGQILDPAIPDIKKTCNGGRQLVDKEIGVPTLVSPTTVRNNDGSVSMAFSGRGSDPNITASFLGPIRWNLTVTILGGWLYRISHRYPYLFSSSRALRKWEGTLAIWSKFSRHLKLKRK
jgi:hypothetical protein